MRDKKSTRTQPIEPNPSPNPIHEAKGEIGLVGGMYDLTTGKVEFY